MMSIKEKRAQTIVIIEWALFTVATTLLLFFAIDYTVEAKKNYPHEYGDDTVAVWIFVTSTVVISSLLTGTLNHGVHSGHSCSCKTWYVINIGFLALGVAALVRMLMLEYYLTFAIGIAIYAYRVYAVKTIIDYTSMFAISPGLVYEQRKPAPLGDSNTPPTHSMPNEGNTNVV